MIITPVIVLLWLAFGFVCAYIAKEKGRSVPYFFVLGFLLGPIGLVITLFARRWFYDERLKITGSPKYLNRVWEELSPEERELLEHDEHDEAPAGSPSAELTRLADLHESGALTDSEFRAAKAQALGMTAAPRRGRGARRGGL